MRSAGEKRQMPRERLLGDGSCAAMRGIKSAPWGRSGSARGGCKNHVMHRLQRAQTPLIGQSDVGLMWRRMLRHEPAAGEPHHAPVPRLKKKEKKSRASPRDRRGRVRAYLGLHAASIVGEADALRVAGEVERPR